MNFETPFQHRDPTGLRHEGFNAYLLSRREARNSQAGKALNALYFQETFDGRLLTQEDRNTPGFYLGNDTHVLTLFGDFSAFLSKRTEEGLLAYPQVLELAHTVFLSYASGVELAPISAHYVRLKGPANIIDLYKSGFKDALDWMVSHLDTLPDPVDPRTQNTGFWPAFAPIIVNEEAIQEAFVLYTNVLRGILLESDLEPDDISSCIVLPINDYDSLSSGLYVSSYVETYFGNENPDQILNKILRTLLRHPNFPIQGRDWIAPVDLSDFHQPETDQIILTYDPKPLSAHEKLDALRSVQEWISKDDIAAFRQSLK